MGDRMVFLSSTTPIDEENVKVRWLPPSGRFGEFGIRYAEFES